MLKQILLIIKYYYLIVDGTGYVEDGREIFDDDDEIDDTYVATDSKDSGRGLKRKARVAPQAAGKGNIRNLLGAMPTKKKEVCLYYRSITLIQHC